MFLLLNYRIKHWILVRFCCQRGGGCSIVHTDITDGILSNVQITQMTQSVLKLLNWVMLITIHKSVSSSSIFFLQHWQSHQAISNYFPHLRSNCLNPLHFSPTTQSEAWGFHLAPTWLNALPILLKMSRQMKWTVRRIVHTVVRAHHLNDSSRRWVLIIRDRYVWQPHNQTANHMRKCAPQLTNQSGLVHFGLPICSHAAQPLSSGYLTHCSLPFSPWRADDCVSFGFLCEYFRDILLISLETMSHSGTLAKDYEMSRFINGSLLKHFDSPHRAIESKLPMLYITLKATVLSIYERRHFRIDFMAYTVSPAKEIRQDGHQSQIQRPRCSWHNRWRGWP